MIDFHNHILPNVDDGSKSIEMSIDMLKEAQYQGITDVVNTVHLQHPKMHDKNVKYDFLIGEIKKLQDTINLLDLKINIHLAAEVFYLPNLLEVSNNHFFSTIGNRKYMLIEFASTIFPIGYEDEFYKLQLEGITPIIAHPERYRFIQNDISILEDWIRRDFIIQLDAGSLIGKFGRATKEVAYNILKNDCMHIIGSDAHNNNNRNFCLKEAYELIEKSTSADRVEKLKLNVCKILGGENIF